MIVTLVPPTLTPEDGLIEAGNRFEGRRVGVGDVFAEHADAFVGRHHLVQGEADRFAVNRDGAAHVAAGHRVPRVTEFVESVRDDPGDRPLQPVPVKKG